MRITGGKKLKILLSFFVFSFFVFSLFIVFSTIVDSASCPSGYQCTDNAKKCRKYCKSSGQRVEDMIGEDCSATLKGKDKCCLCKAPVSCPSGYSCVENAKKCRKSCKNQGKRVDDMQGEDCSYIWGGRDKCCKCKDGSSVNCPSGTQCTDNAKNCRKYCKSLGKKVESMNSLDCSLSLKGMDKCCACKSMPQCPSGSQCTDNAKKCRKYCKSLGKKVESMTSLDCSLSLKGKDKCCKCKT